MYVKVHEVIRNIPVKEMNSGQIFEVIRVLVVELVNRAMDRKDDDARDHLYAALRAFDHVEDNSFLDYTGETYND